MDSKIINHISNIECEVIRDELPANTAINELDDIQYHNDSLINAVQNLKEIYGFDNQIGATLKGAQPLDEIFSSQLVQNANLNVVVVIPYDKAPKLVYRPVNIIDVIKFSEGIKEMLNNYYMNYSTKQAKKAAK